MVDVLGDGRGNSEIIMDAIYPGQCGECGREIWVDDRIEWDPKTKVALHLCCSLGYDPPNRREGSAATIELDLPHRHSKYEDDDKPVNWNNYKPREGM